MFRSCFNNDLENASDFEADGCCNSVILFAKAANSSKLLFAWSLHLVSDTNQRDPTARGKIVNPHWIEKNVIRQWKRGCDRRNNKDCQMCPAASRLILTRPCWLIDTWRLCLTTGAVNAPYVALSYVWGEEPFFKTTRNDLPWHSQIQNMASIFANATVTIIAMQGANANYGLRGLRGISKPRNLVQDIFTLGEGSSITTTQQQNEDQNPWSQRGWTFQEQIFSRRQLVFSADRVQWKCACGNFLEDLMPPPASEVVSQSTQSRDHVFSTSIPNFNRYAELVRQYNDRQFTFPEDALAAFSGITTALSHTFYGGFICGLPALFLDMALVWQPDAKCQRRVPSKPSNPTKLGLPSWSWVGWKGKIDHNWSLGCRFEYMVSSRHESLSVPRTIPLVQWYSRSWENMELAAIKEPLELQELKKRGLKGIGSIPPGWRRFDYHGVAYEPEMPPARYVYKHDCDPTTEFWYPIPLCEGQHNPPRPRGTDTLLCCRTQRIWAFLSQKFSHSTREYTNSSIRNSKGTWIGELRLHDNKIPTKNLSQSHQGSESGDLCELIAISWGYFYEKWDWSVFQIDEWNHKERPRDSEKYEFYNVLWVEWQDGIAYRKACGRVMKSAWECQELEWVDLVLG
ncbi:hypothetical protein OIDMADRAFT_153536 [Oidiodendron maius Zn]|uniref:Heterokaryon incompatibility domain-containing protein n=1 Tax=Oidiodendron maius (strain Zn) TaxID=913774 RepID=A0A0C3E3H9_OIDMZ|nr:hypothetical protein OIDMADRAFT_153536 [Oidiodendron maius Zn]